MSTRRELLTHLFQLLEARQVPYCVLRNYGDLFAEQTSDVDLITLPEQAATVIACCREAGAATAHVMVQLGRFAEYSLVFWNGATGFVRIDVDTEQRWRLLHVITAAQIVTARRARENFYVPAAAHEAVIVLTQALWQGRLSERYAGRLRALRAELGDAQNLTVVFDEAFGLRENLLAAIEDPRLPQRLARAGRGSVLRRPAKAFGAIAYAFKDLARLAARRKAPPGLFLRMVGVHKPWAQELSKQLALLFPENKSRITDGPMPERERRRILFKGGLAIELLPAAAKPAALLRQDWPELDRSFAVVGEAAGRAQFIHIGSGRMASGNDVGALAQFIGTSLARSLQQNLPRPRGAFAVLLGLDGAGKTTLARNLASRAPEARELAGVRYFHWLPPVGKALEFPLLEPGNQPRKPRLTGGVVQSSLSVLRLGKNLIRAHLAWWFQLRRWRQRGYLVLVDRYFYNYYLDPVSVKYYGPRWVLKALSRLFPKPEIVITLSAPPEVLGQRKQELSEAEMRVQASTLQQLKFPTPRIIAADAREPAEVVAEKTLAALQQMLS